MLEDTMKLVSSFYRELDDETRLKIKDLKDSEILSEVNSKLTPEVMMELDNLGFNGRFEGDHANSFRVQSISEDLAQSNDPVIREAAESVISASRGEYQDANIPKPEMLDNSELNSLRMVHSVARQLHQQNKLYRSEKIMSLDEALHQRNQNSHSESFEPPRESESFDSFMKKLEEKHVSHHKDGWPMFKRDNDPSMG